MGPVFIDLDRTLIDVNSAHSWLRHEWNAGRVGVVHALRASMWFGLYALGKDGLAYALNEAAALYRDVPASQIQQLTDAWFQRDIRSHLRPGAAAVLARHREAGQRIILATTSSQFVASCAQAEWGFDDVVCTMVGVDPTTGLLTGQIADSAYGRQKLRRCREWADAHDVDLKDCTFYTDSASDLSLLREVGTPVVVHPDRRLLRIARAEGWPIQDWGASTTD
ncbi:MAG: HAD family hydrolase [Myxococcota bacterium]